MNKAAEQDVDFDATETQDVEEATKEEETSSEVEIEIVDDTPEEDKGRARRAEGAEPDIPDDEELESYSEGVQKRLKKMKWEFHEERRAKEESERLKEEAVTYAQKIKEENCRAPSGLYRLPDYFVLRRYKSQTVDESTFFLQCLFVAKQTLSSS